MLEAEIFSAKGKAKLNRSRHNRAINEADVIEVQIVECMIAPDRPVPGRVAELLEALERAMATAAGGDAWSEIWIRYCRWQQCFLPELTELALWVHADSRAHYVLRFAVFQMFYADDPDPVPGCWKPQGDELVAKDLLRVHDSPQVELWRTPLGRALAAHLQCAESPESVLSSRAIFQQRLIDAIRAVDPDLVEAACSKILTELEASDLLVPLAAAASDSQIWAALAHVRQVILFHEDEDAADDAEG